MKKGYGSCPGTCGELVQGLIDKNEYISSYCVDMYSNAIIKERVNSNDRLCNKKRKSMKAISSVFQRFGYSRNLLYNIDLNINSRIPMGKGMASSTADVGASVMAALDFLGEKMSPQEISKLVSKIEPTDSIYFRDVCIFDPIKGEKLKSLGYLDCKKVLILEPKDKINTVKIRKDKDYYNILKKNKDITKASFELLSMGFESGNLEYIRKACLNSALANEDIKKTPFLNELVDLSLKNHGGFVNISHTGTVVGIAICDDTDVEKILFDIKNSDIRLYYEKKYVRRIISGGILKGKGGRISKDKNFKARNISRGGEEDGLY